MSSDSTQNATPTDTDVAQQAAQRAVLQARESATQAANAIRSLDSTRLGYLGCLAVVVVFTLLFDMASFTVATPDHAVSETVAQAQRDAQARLNSWSYSAFTSTGWGKLMWLSALCGVGIVIWSAVKKSAAAWVPLAQVGFAGATTLFMMLLFFVAFPDLSAYSDADSSATLLGYWLPLFAAAAATFLSLKPLLPERQAN